MTDIARHPIEPTNTKGNTMTTTLSTVLERAKITVPDATIADLVVPVLTAPQRQGDVGIFPRPAVGAAELSTFVPVPADGVAVVRGEATGNTHLLMPEPGHPVYWQPANPAAGDVMLGVLHVPAGSVAWLIHTDEHGANGIGAGTYTLRGKREQAEEVRRVQD